MMDALHDILNPWLGQPTTKRNEGRVTFIYRLQSEDTPPLPLRLKVETNTREHFSVYGFKEIPFSVESRWFEGSCSIHTYELDELLGTKLRALYQRRQGRDLFDMAIAMKSGKTDPDRIVAAFQKYMEHEDHKVTRVMFEENFHKKLDDPEFMADISPLLASGYEWDAAAAAPSVKSTYIERLPGEPWKGAQKKPEKEK